MTNKKLGLMLVLCCSIAFFTVRTQSETDDPNQTRKSKDSEYSWDIIVQERIKAYEDFDERVRKIDAQAKKWREEFNELLRSMPIEQRLRALKQRQKEDDEFSRQYKLARDQLHKELAKLGLGPLVSREERREMASRRQREFFYVKHALGVTEEKWKLIKPKLERIRQLHEQTKSTVRISPTERPGDKMTSGRTRPGSRTEAFEWWMHWKDKAGAERTEVRKLSEQLVVLLKRSNTTPQAFRAKMDALRKARAEEAELMKLQLSEVRKELRELLTTREEAALVLMRGLP